MAFLSQVSEDPATFLEGEDAPFPDDLIERDEVFQYLITQHAEQIEIPSRPFTS